MISFTPYLDRQGRWCVTIDWTDKDGQPHRHALPPEDACWMLYPLHHAVITMISLWRAGVLPPPDVPDDMLLPLPVEEYR